MRRWLGWFLVLVAGVVIVPVAPATAQTTATIQPGVPVHSSVGSCTLGFIFRGAGGAAGTATYASVAAHCIEAVGEAVQLESGEAFGDVAFMGDPATSASDFAFIRVRAAFLPRLVPAVKGHPTYPAGYTSVGDLNPFDQVQMSGYGEPFWLLPFTQERRVGMLVSSSAERFAMVAPGTPGDSGGPLVHRPTGRAIGLVSRICLGLCTAEGPTVEGILGRAAAAGFPVQLRNA